MLEVVGVLLLSHSCELAALLIKKLLQFKQLNSILTRCHILSNHFVPDEKK